jgi:hypothetical protein
VTQSAHHSGLWDWDRTIALEYAVEQLFNVSQLLTCEITPSTEKLSISYLECISSLLQHEELLPKTVAIGLRDAQQEYLRMQRRNVHKVQCDCLASRLLAILRDVSKLLTAAKFKVAA